MTIKRKYISAAISLAIVICINYLISIYIISQNKGDARLVNIAGKQRMVSQRLNILATKAYNFNTTKDYNNAKTTFNYWKTAHLALIHGDTNFNTDGVSKSENELHDDLESTLKLITDVEKIITSEKYTLDDLDELEIITSTFLPKMDAIVFDLEMIAESKIDKLIYISITLLFLVFLILFVEFRYLIIPSLNSLKTKESNLQEKNNEITEIQTHLKAILDSSNSINILIDKNYTIKNFNKKAKEVGHNYFTKALALNTDIREFLNKKDTELLHNHMSKIMTGERVDIEVERQVKDVLLCFEIKYYPVYVNEKIVGSNINISNVTDRKLKTKKIKEQEVLLNSIYQSTSEACFFINKDLKIKYFNDVATQVCKDQINIDVKVNDLFETITPKDYKDEFNVHIKNSLNGHKIKIERLAKNSWWQFSFQPVLDTNKKILGVAFNILNINEQKLQEIEVERIDHRLRKTIESIPHAIILIEDDKIKFTNDKFEELLGYKKEEALDETIDFLLPERYKANHSKLQEAYYNSESEDKSRMQMGRFLPVITKNGLEMTANISLNSYIEDNKKQVIVILQDVTDLKLQQDVIMSQNEALKKIASQQSNELKEPITNIKDLCHVLNSKSASNSSDLTKNINAIINEIEEIDNIVTKIVTKANEENFLL